MQFPLEPEALAREIDLPLTDWPLNCHGVATRVLERAPIRGMRLARGHYHGPVSAKSQYRGGVGQHSWLVLEDGRILDPTRWAMERPGAPSIYLGENDVYDEAGLELSAGTMPRFPGSKIGFEPRLAAADPEALAELCAALGRSAPTDLDPDGTEINRLADTLHWRLKSPPEQLDDPARLYRALEAVGLKALVKIDLWNLVMKPETITVGRGVNRTFDAPPREEMTEAQILTRIFCKFLIIEARPHIESELEELGYTLDDLYEALNDLERCTKNGIAKTIEDIPSFYLTDLNVISADLLGRGFGQDIRVERFAASLGVSRTELDELLRRAGDRTGYCTGWL